MHLESQFRLKTTIVFNFIFTLHKKDNKVLRKGDHFLLLIKERVE
jgi:hypothetical protein